VEDGVWTAADAQKRSELVSSLSSKNTRLVWAYTLRAIFFPCLILTAEVLGCDLLRFSIRNLKNNNRSIILDLESTCIPRLISTLNSGGNLDVKYV